MTVAQASHGRAGRAWPWRHVTAAAGFGLAALVVWLLAYGTDRGLRFDLEAAHGLDTPGYDIDFFLFSVRIVVPLTFVAIAAAALLGRRRHALAAAAILVGTSASCVVLKTVLGRLDPLHGDAARGVGEFFPSVHTGAAAGAALGLTVLAVGGLRLPTAFAAAAYIAAVGTASIVAGGHFPSDVAGALLVAAAWGSLAAGMLALGGGEGDGGASVQPLLAAGVAAAAAIPVLAVVTDSGWTGDHLASTATLAALALLAPAFLVAFLTSLRSKEVVA